MIKFKFKGRSYSSARSLAEAMNKDMQSSIERNITSAARLSGLSVRKTSKGLQLEGDSDEMRRFYDRLK